MSITLWIIKVTYEFGIYLNWYKMDSVVNEFIQIILLFIKLKIIASSYKKDFTIDNWRSFTVVLSK